MTLKDQSFFHAMLVARLADQILLFVVPLVVFRSTGSVGWSGIAFFAESLPRYVAFPVSGMLCDRIPPLRLLKLSQLARGLVSIAGLGCYAASGGIGWLVALSALCGVLTTQGTMAREVMLPQLFRAHRFESVAAYTQIAEQLGTVLGPMLAAFLIDLWPWQALVALAAGLFLAADLLTILWQRAARPQLADPEPPGGPWTLPLRTAARHVRHLPGLWPAVALAAGVNLVIGVTLATSAALFTGLHGRSGFDYGMLQTAGAAAMILILFAVAHIRVRLRVLGITGYLAMLLGAAFTGLASGAGLYAAGFVLVVGFDKMFNVYVRTIRQRIIPQRDFGKTTGLVVLLNNLPQPVAGLLVGLAGGSPAGAARIVLALTLVMALIGLTLAARARRHGLAVDRGA